MPNEPIYFDCIVDERIILIISTAFVMNRCIQTSFIRTGCLIRVAIFSFKLLGNSHVVVVWLEWITETIQLWNFLLFLFASQMRSKPKNKWKINFFAKTPPPATIMCRQSTHFRGATLFQIILTAHTSIAS